jgi:hypothetical protein
MRALLLSLLATPTALAGHIEWPLGVYDCVVDHAVSIQVRAEETVSGLVRPDPERFVMRLAAHSAKAECGALDLAHASVTQLMGCARDSRKADVGDYLGGTLYEFGRSRYMDSGLTSILLLDTDRKSFLWSFLTPGYSSTYRGTCEAARRNKVPAPR